MSSNSQQADWLPPSPEPIVPADVRPNNPVWYVPPRLPQPGESRFFIMKQGLKPLVNYGWREDDAVEAFQQDAEGKFPTIVRKSSLVKPKGGDDLIDGFPRMVSKRLLDILLEFASQDVEYQKVITKFREGEAEDYFVRVSRRINSVDYANSKSLYEQSEGYPPYPSSTGPARLVPIEGTVHVFLDARKWASMFVSVELKDRVMSLDPPPSNIAFYDPAEASFFF